MYVEKKKREKIEKEAKEARRRESETFKHQNCLQVLPNLLLPELQKKWFFNITS